MYKGKTLFYTAIAALSFPASSSALSEQKDISSDLKGYDGGVDAGIQVIIGNATQFLYLLAVIYGLWGGYKILTAGADSKKVDEGKSIITHTVLGLVVIFLASSIIQWVVKSLLGMS